VGYNPFRTRVKRRSDVVIVAAALVVIAALVAWAALG
jgi:chorismate synthase